jgi:hypothetical protein
MAIQEQRVLYKCPICLRCSDTQDSCHQHQMVRCEMGEPGDESTQPVQTGDGRVLTHAPRWWVMAVWDRARRAGGRLQDSTKKQGS